MDFSSLVNERKEEMSFYTSFPNINDLVCTMCEVDRNELCDSSAKSMFHWQTMKCRYDPRIFRLLICLISDVIASPVLDKTKRFIFVVAHKQLFEAAKLERILKNFKLMYHGLTPLTTEIYKDCLKFTIQTRLSPLWNRVGNYLVLGKEFYNSTDGIDAVELNINIDDKNVYLKLRAEKIRIPRVKLEDYVPPLVIPRFLAYPKAHIDLLDNQLPFVRVLPSTNRGKVLSISKELPERCVFKDYDQLRRHWKNMYGYSLPKNKEEISFFCQIKFFVPKSNIFTYPCICIASGPIDVIPVRKDKSPIITQFLSDTLSKLPIVCGKQLQISKHTTVSLDAYPTCSILKEGDLNTNSDKEGDTTAQLEFSTKDESSKKINTAFIQKQLAKIHQIHNTTFDENMRRNTNDRNIRENQNDTQSSNAERDSCDENMENVCIENNVPGSLISNFTASNGETISQYFKSKKNRPGQEPNRGEKRKCETLKETVIETTSNENNFTSLQETDKNNIEAMARRNRLHELQCSELSDWLKKHSVPHKSKEKKSELIKKILSHIRNTEILHKFRV